MDRLEKMLSTHLKRGLGSKPKFLHLKRLLLQRAAVESQRRAGRRALFWLTMVSVALSVAVALWL